MRKEEQERFPLFLDLPSLITKKPITKTLIIGEKPERLTIYLSALAAFLGFRVLIADGANAFDPYLVSRFARKEKFPPAALLRKISIARAFTCHQFTTLIQERLEPLLSPETNSLIVLLGPGTMFFDEDVPGEEATFLFRQTLAKIDKLSKGRAFFLLSQSLRGINHRRVFLLRELFRLADVVLKLKLSREEKQIVLTKPPLPLPRPWRVFEEFKKLAISADVPNTPDGGEIYGADSLAF